MEIKQQEQIAFATAFCVSTMVLCSDTLYRETSHETVTDRRHSTADTLSESVRFYQRGIKISAVYLFSASKAIDISDSK